MRTERITIDLPNDVYDLLRSGGDISAFHRRAIIEAAKIAAMQHLPPVRYEDEEIRIALPDKGVVVNGQWTPLPESERVVLHKLLYHGGWVPIAYLYGHQVCTTQDKAVARKWISMLRKKIGRHRIENCNPGLYRFVKGKAKRP